MPPDTERMDDPRADEPATVVAGSNRSREWRKALHPPTSAQGKFDAISAQRPGADCASARRVRTPRPSTPLSSLVVGTFATGMSATGRDAVRSGRTVGTYATGQATR